MMKGFSPKMYLFLLLCMGFFARQGTAQVANNMNLISNWDNNSLPVSSGVVFNDIWGYVDGAGREYAILGSIQGFFIFDITVPASPVQVAFELGGSTSAIWRDFKTYQNYLYAVSDQGSGSSLQIFDLSGLPGSITKVYDSQALFSLAHNIFINETTGRLYVAGASVQPNGILIYDISTTPASPQQLGSVPLNGLSLGGYIHDIYVRNDTVYTFNGNAGFSVFNFAGNNLGTWAQIGQMNTYPEQGYSHSGWATPDHQYLIHADETHDTGLKITDLSNYVGLNTVTTFRSALLGPSNTASIVHNPFVMGNLVFVAYYHDGVQVFDISNPTAPTQVAGYDTYLSHTDYTGFDGCWGVYPYLPSGNIIASDTENGLFVLSMTTMPVEFAGFEASLDAGTVFLNWTTASELNNDYFQVERSADGLEWETIDKVSAAGTSTRDKHYAAVDEAPISGTSYYRITQVDFDGTTSHSESRMIATTFGYELHAVYPNPAEVGQAISLNFSLEQAGDVQYVLTDLMGKVVANHRNHFPAGAHVVDMPTDNLPAGVYRLILNTQGGREVRQVVLSH